jgi:hypothetical protein
MKTNLLRSSLFALLAVMTSTVAYVACGDDSSAVKETLPDGGPTPGTDSGPNPGTDGGDGGSDCFENPKTHFEIINACTTATKITKNSTLKKLGPDGGLPPLQ